MSKENVNGDVDENLLPKNESSVEFQIRTSGSPRKGEPFAAADDVTSLETIAERRMRKNSHYVIYCTTFIMSIGFSIILTGVWPYLKQLDPTASKAYLGWVIAANPIGQMLFSPLLGWWANKAKSTRIAFVITLMLSIVGSAMYALLPLMKNTSGYLIFVSRFIVGLSGANIAICRSYIVASTKLKERTSALAAVAAAQAIGFILGPSLQAALMLMNSPTDELSSSSNETTLVDGMSSSYNGTNIVLRGNENIGQIWGPYAMTGWIGVILGIFNLLLYFPCFFKESSLAAKEVEMKSRDQSNATFHQKTNYCALFVILFEIFDTVLIFVLIETLIVPLCMDLYAWTGDFAVKVVGIALTVTGVFSFFMFILSGYLSKRYDERKLFIVLGLIPMAISMLLFFPVGGNYPQIKYCNTTSSEILPYNDTATSALQATVIDHDCDELGCPASQKWCFYTPVTAVPQLVLACIFCSIGYPMSMSLSNAIFSKMLGFRPQAFWMGMLSGVSSFSRAAGPIFVTFMYTIYGTRWTFGFLFVLMLFVIALSLIFFKGFKSMQIITEQVDSKHKTSIQNGKQLIKTTSLKL